MKINVFQCLIRAVSICLCNTVVLLKNSSILFTKVFYESFKAKIVSVLGKEKHFLLNRKRVLHTTCYTFLSMEPRFRPRT